MATATKRPRCKYWDSCFREDPRHLAKYLHPEKDEQSETDESKKDEEEPARKKVKFEEKVEKEAPETKPVLKRKRTHDMSESEDDESVSTASPPKRKMVTAATNTDEETKTDVTEETKTKVTATAVRGKRRQRCTYWAKCYRKDPTHLKTFIHPGDKDENILDYGEEEGTKLTRGKKKSLIKPLHEMKDGDTADITNKGVTYKLKRTGDHYYCTCLGWKNQNKATDKRTCKHLREYLGDEFEECRCGLTSSTASSSSNVATINRSPRHKQIKQLLLAHKWQEESQDPKGWWMSEKLDGVRAFWDGTTFFSRLGNEFIPPSWFIKDFPPDMELDGELFGGRAKFQSTVSIVKTPGSDKWKEITYEVFDVPSLGTQPFEKRIKAARDYFDENPVKHVNVLEQVRCKGPDHIEAEIQKVEALGGEGLMIREPGSKYVHGRSNTLLKIKKFHDAEAKVIGYMPGKGNNTGKTGALRCVMECGKEFSVGSGLTNKDRTRPPKIGSIITYKFQELTNSGVPRFPSYLGVRIDMDGPKDAILPEGKTKNVNA